MKKAVIDCAIDNPKLEGRVTNRKELIIDAQRKSD